MWNTKLLKKLSIWWLDHNTLFEGYLDLPFIV